MSEFATAIAANYPGWDGFLGTRASLATDLAVVAMAVVLPVLAWSVRLAQRGNYDLHRRIQLTMTGLLLIVVAALEVDVRINGWQIRASGNAGSPSTAVWSALAVHLVFAVSTAILWPTVVFLALRRFPKPPAPGSHSVTHKRWARAAAIGLTATAATGWIFYFLAFT